RDRAEIQAVGEMLGSVTREPVLAGMQTNLYMLFMTNTWNRAGANGVVGLLHPEAHLVDPNGGALREATYARLRRHWEFVNELFLFPDVGHPIHFGVHIYGSAREAYFIQAVNLLTPATADRSMDHDGSGEIPGIQYPEGGWDLRPHSQRIVTVDRVVLGDWVALFDSPGTAPERSRLLRPLTQADLEALRVFAQQSRRLGDTTRYWTSGFHEKGAKDEGTIAWRTEYPPALKDCILQGPHILNATPFAQQPRENCKSKGDWDALDLETLPARFIPRTNYQRAIDAYEFTQRQAEWEGRPYSRRYREAHREFIQPGHERTVKACILPPGPTHINIINSVSLSTDLETAMWAGCLASLPFDYLTKVSGASGLKKNVIERYPLVDGNELMKSLLALRTLRLNCVTQDYTALWELLFDDCWGADLFVAGSGIARLGEVASSWNYETPLRLDLDRWLALTEIDAIVALMLGLTEEQLLQMYRSQFAVLRKYEHVTVFDTNGRQISGIHQNYGYHQQQWEDALKAAPTRRGEKKVGMWDRVKAHMAGDTDVDLGPFVPPFVPADREKAMSTAYRAFQARLTAS
ncbi:MAG: hypothetical protein LC667_18260, partial [Thioalkalivibrio sp.]|nr:hypothetical protein [Thioalkalivibrio sp.]